MAYRRARGAEETNHGDNLGLDDGRQWDKSQIEREVDLDGAKRDN